MKHFSLRLSILLLIVIVASATSFYLFSNGMWAQATFTVIAGLIAVIMLFALIDKLSSLFSMFLKGLLARDTTIHFNFSRHDPLLYDLAEDMNTISSIYHESNSQLETSKLYYDRILKIMTHEMRNYVAPVISTTSDVSAHPDNYLTSDSLKEVISIIHSQGNGIRRFLDSYYNLTHIPSLKIETIQAAAFISRLIPLVSDEIASRSLDSSICRYEVPQNMAMNIDVSLMSQAMINLIRNSLDAIAFADNPVVEIKISISEGNAFITITDNGSGISKNVIDNLFQPFFTSKPDGCGVGLTVSRQIIRRHNEDLTLLHASQPTIFAITLPTLKNN